MTKRVPLVAIERDTSIQCRASIDIAVVNDYAERMTAGDTFPPVVLFGTPTKCWIGDGWHRIFAAEQNEAKTIAATLQKGTRLDALKHALSANALHGHRRSNADKARCVEVALREFSKLSTARIADLCGVARATVESLRPQDVKLTSSRTGADGKQYPAHRRRASAPPEDAASDIGPDTEPGFDLDADAPNQPCEALDYAKMAIRDLEKIAPDDANRTEAFALIRRWLNAHGA